MTAGILTLYFIIDYEIRMIYDRLVHLWYWT